MRSLIYRNLKVEKYKNSNQLILKGEITNEAGKYYSSIAIRVILFIKNVIVVNEVFLINDLPNGATKVFERRIYDMSQGESVNDITRFEVFTENAY